MDEECHNWDEARKCTCSRATIHVSKIAGAVLRSFMPARDNGYRSIDEMLVLNYTFLNQPVSCQDIIEGTGLPPSRVSRYLTKGLGRGSLTYITDEDDQRKKLIRFTSEAMQQTEEWAEGLIQAIKNI